jgi:hypothetical protein
MAGNLRVPDVCLLERMGLWVGPTWREESPTLRSVWALTAELTVQASWPIACCFLPFNFRRLGPSSLTVISLYSSASPFH